MAEALEALRLDGAIFFRAEYSEPWSYESPIGLEQVLRPGSQRLIYFHVVAAGRCWIRVGDDEAHWASAGDVIVLPYGSQHTVGGVDDADLVPITSLLESPPWASMPVLRYGGGGARTDIVWLPPQRRSALRSHVRGVPTRVRRPPHPLGRPRSSFMPPSSGRWRRVAVTNPTGASRPGSPSCS